MDAGQLNEIIEILKPVSTKNEYGEEQEVLQKCYSTRARVDYNGGNRNIANNEIEHDYNKIFYVRQYVPVEDNFVILYQGQKWQVTWIEKDRSFYQKIIHTSLITD